MNEKKKIDLGGLIKKHPKEIGLGAVAAVVVVLGLKKKSAGGMAPSIAETGVGGGNSATGFLDTSGSDQVQANLDHSISSLNTRIDNLSSFITSPAAESPTVNTDVTSALSQEVSQLTKAITGLLSPPIVSPPPPVTDRTPSPITPKIELLPYTPPSTFTDDSGRPADRAQVTSPVALLSAPVTQGLLGPTTLPRSARGD